MREIRNGNGAGPETNTRAAAETYASVLRGGRSETDPNSSGIDSPNTVVSSVVSEQMTDGSTQFGSTRCDSIPFSSTHDCTASVTGGCDGSMNTDHDGYADTGQGKRKTKDMDTVPRSVSVVDDNPPLLRRRNQGQSRVKHVECGFLHSVKTSCIEREKSKKHADKSEASDTNSCVRTCNLGCHETTSETTSLSQLDGTESQARVCNGTNNGQVQSVDTCTTTGSPDFTGSEVVEIAELVDALPHKEEESANKSGKTADPALVQWCPISPR